MAYQAVDEGSALIRTQTIESAGGLEMVGRRSQEVVSPSSPQVALMEEIDSSSSDDEEMVRTGSRAGTCTGLTSKNPGRVKRSKTRLGHMEMNRTQTRTGMRHRGGSTTSPRTSPDGENTEMVSMLRSNPSGLDTGEQQGCFSRWIDQLPAVIMLSLMNLQEGVPYGLLFFPSIFGKYRVLGVSMFFISCFVSQACHSTFTSRTLSHCAPRPSLPSSPP